MTTASKPYHSVILGAGISAWCSCERDYDHGELPPDMPAVKLAGQFLVPQELLDEYVGMSDLLGKALRGEITFKPLPPPKRHRCLFCWLVSLLPGHERCDHGGLYCDDCRDDY